MYIFVIHASRLHSRDGKLTFRYVKVSGNYFNCQQSDYVHRVSAPAAVAVRLLPTDNFVSFGYNEIIHARRRVPHACSMDQMLGAPFDTAGYLKLCLACVSPLERILLYCHPHLPGY